MGFCFFTIFLSVYQLKNQPPVSKEGPFSRGRRVKGTESARRKRTRKTEQDYMQYRGKEWGIGVGRTGYSGPGMQAVFLGGSGSRSGSPGTGVFLPRDPTDLKNKSGTVLFSLWKCYIKKCIWKRCKGFFQFFLIWKWVSLSCFEIYILWKIFDFIFNLMHPRIFIS